MRQYVFLLLISAALTTAFFAGLSIQEAQIRDLKRQLAERRDEATDPNHLQRQLDQTLTSLEAAKQTIADLQNQERQRTQSPAVIHFWHNQTEMLYYRGPWPPAGK